MTIPIGRCEAIAGGWAVAPIISMHTGFPLALYNFDQRPVETPTRAVPV